MSWSAYTAALPDQVKDRVAALTVPGVTEDFPARDDQVTAAKAAAVALIDSGAVGTGEAFTISLSGHANTDHKPQAGYSNDFVSVSIGQTTAAAVATYDQQQEQAQKNLE